MECVGQLLIAKHRVVEAILGRYVDALGAEGELYKNHVYRGLNLQLKIGHLEVSDELAVAWATHDLGLWTERTLDYLEPSARLAEELGREFGVEQTRRLRQMVEYHHCLRPLHDPVVESFRLADRADAWPKRWKATLSLEEIDQVVRAFPYCGFHMFLGRSALRYALLHPWRPVPMFRWRAPVAV